MDAVEIVQLSPQDWQLFRQIRLEALQDSPQAFGSSYSFMASQPDSFWQNRLSSAATGQDSWLLFARINERIVGMIGAYIPEGSPIPRVVSVYVTPEYRRTGVSRGLMDAILNVLKQKGSFQIVELGVMHDQEAALRLYRRYGFEIVAKNEKVSGDTSKGTSTCI